MTNISCVSMFENSLLFRSSIFCYAGIHAELRYWMYKMRNAHAFGFANVWINMLVTCVIKHLLKCLMFICIFSYCRMDQIRDDISKMQQQVSVLFICSIFLYSCWFIKVFYFVNKTKRCSPKQFWFKRRGQFNTWNFESRENNHLMNGVGFFLSSVRNWWFLRK